MFKNCKMRFFQILKDAGVNAFFKIGVLKFVQKIVNFKKLLKFGFLKPVAPTSIKSPFN